MRALVTGPGGIVGANIVRELLAQGWEVRALVRRRGTPRALEDLPVEIASGNVVDARSLRGVIGGVDVVFHTATPFAYWGIPSDEMEAVAVRGTRNVIEAASDQGARRVVLTSSSVIFGSSATAEAPRNETARFTDEDASPYAQSKLRQHRLALQVARERGVDLVSVCPTLAVGAFDYGLSTSNAVIARYLNDPFRTTFAGGANLVAASDVARAHLLVAESGKASEAYIVGSENRTWRDLHRIMSEAFHTPGPLSETNHTIAFLTAAWSEAWAGMTRTTPALTRAEARMVGRYYWYDDSKARALGYAPLSACEAIVEAARWLFRTDSINPFVRAGLFLDQPSSTSAK